MILMADTKEKTQKLERIYIVNLSEAYESVRNKRAGKAIKLLRSFISRHMKADEENVSISGGVNSAIWRDSIQKPPRKLKVRTVKEGEKATVWLIGEQEEAEKKKAEEKKKDAKPKEKKAEQKKEEPGAEPKNEQKDEKSKEEAKKDKGLEKAIKDAQRNV
jgi:large subunit ribosomal protein L31e